MNIEELIHAFKTKPYLLNMGKGALAERLHSSKEDVIKAKRIARGAKLPKILIFDIETSPAKAYIWRMWKENIAPCQVISDWFMVAWSAKWLFSKDVMGDVLTPKEALEESDKRIVTNLWNLINEADIVVSHNGDKFDIPRINTRFIINGLNPPASFFSVDTCAVARKQFGFSSNKLDALATYFGFDHKLDTDFSLWSKCMDGDAESLKYMLIYNKRDVTLLEEVYLKLRPWIKNHPNISNILNDDSVCTVCGTNGLEELDEEYFTGVNSYKLYRCKNCGAIVRGRKSIKSNVKFVNNIR